MIYDWFTLFGENNNACELLLLLETGISLGLLNLDRAIFETAEILELMEFWVFILWDDACDTMDSFWKWDPNVLVACGEIIPCGGYKDTGYDGSFYGDKNVLCGEVVDPTNRRELTKTLTLPVLLDIVGTRVVYGWLRVLIWWRYGTLLKFEFLDEFKQF